MDLVTENVPSAVKDCFPKRKSKEVLFIIYDSYSPKLKYSDITSWGFRNQGRPFFLIDWERLNYQTQAAVFMKWDMLLVSIMSVHQTPRKPHRQIS